MQIYDNTIGALFAHPQEGRILTDVFHNDGYFIALAPGNEFVFVMPSYPLYLGRAECPSYKPRHKVARNARDRLARIDFVPARECNLIQKRCS